MVHAVKKVMLIVFFSFSASFFSAQASTHAWSNFCVSIAARCKNQVGSLVVSSLVGGITGSLTGLVDGVLNNFAPFHWFITWPLENGMREQLVSAVEEELANNQISHNRNTMRTAALVVSWITWALALRSIYGPLYVTTPAVTVVAHR